MRLSSLIGLSKEKRKARLLINACQYSGEVFPHTLIWGAGGLGKTVFARCIGTELKYHFVETHAAAFKHRSVLFSALIKHSQEAQQLRRPLLFFIDEIHRLRSVLQEAVYSVMKEWWIPTSEERINIVPFTLFGATTRFDMLDSNSFVTRFGNVWELDRYCLDDMAIIVANELSKSGLRFQSEVAYDIARRCLGVPRNAVNLANKVRLTALSSGVSEVTLDHTEATFDLEEIDSIGLQPVHRRYLSILHSSRSNGHYSPIGVGSIAAKMRQPEDLIKGSVESILLELNMISPTSRGRILSETGARYFTGCKNFQKTS